MLFKHKLLLLTFILSSCSQLKYALPSHHISIAINSYFKPEGINDSVIYLQKNITKAYDKMLDSLSTIYGYDYYPNYRLPDKHKSTLILKGYFGTQTKNPHYGKYFVKGNFINIWDSLTYPALAVYHNDSAALFSGIISSVTNKNADKDSLHIVATTLRMSGTLVSLVPFNHLLDPVNRPDSIISFSMNNYVNAKNHQNKKIAMVITNLMNNILVFNQHSKHLSNKPNKKIRYNYYPNYRIKTKNKQTAKYIIGGKLSVKNNKYLLILSFKGDNLNLIAPTRIDSILSFSKDAILHGDYSEIIIKLSSKINTFTWQQIMKF